MRHFLPAVLIILGTVIITLTAIRWNNTPWNSGTEFVIKASGNIIAGICYLLAGLLLLDNMGVTWF